jgi:hypothetical protein
MQSYPEPKSKEPELAEMLFNILEQKSTQEATADLKHKRKNFPASYGRSR